ncbi:MAG: NADH-quinone oxidoreductase subunit NuoH [Gemmataceae bacterium]|nr:NADH-quinone oxidoreductase subunit NuoH [Gemmataceae bacterium]
MLEFLQTYWPFILALIAALALITFMLVSAIFSVWLERKVAGRIQDRLGPTRVGGKFGWLQTLADGLKLLVKEDIIPGSADRLLFRLGPYIALAGSFMAFLALPFGHNVVARDMNIAVFFMLAVMSTEVFGIILAGYGSGSKWSLFGGMREAAQMVSYEVPMALCVLVPVIVLGTMNLNVIAQQQTWIWEWKVFNDPFTFAAFWTYFTCATASCKRAPFDLAEAESELVAGFHTEYSGFRWLSLFMAEYGTMFAVSGIANILFLGGWGLGFYPELATTFLGPVFGNIINVTVFIFKCWLLVFVMMWVRWTLPRLRIDQVMMTCLKYLLPISCVLLLGVSLWRLMIPEFIQTVFPYLMTIACLGGTLMMVWKVATWFSAPPGSAMPGMWRNVGVTGYQGARQR